MKHDQNPILLDFLQFSVWQSLPIFGEYPLSFILCPLSLPKPIFRPTLFIFYNMKRPNLEVRFPCNQIFFAQFISIQIQYQFLSHFGARVITTIMRQTRKIWMYDTFRKGQAILIQYKWLLIVLISHLWRSPISCYLIFYL